VRILVVHTAYVEPGGEDRVVEAEVALLRDRGHDVRLFGWPNSSLAEMTTAGAAATALWNVEARKQLKRLLDDFRPQLAHVHNTFLATSISVVHGLIGRGVPVVATMHNYRYACANGLLFRDGAPCEACIGLTIGRPALARGCYRDSKAATLVATGVRLLSRSMGTWQKVQRIIAPTHFGRQILVRSGLPPEKLVVKPHFVDCAVEPQFTKRGYAAYVGRLSNEKGIGTLLEAWKRLPTDIPLRVAGDGPMHAEVVRASVGRPIEMLGRLDSAGIFELMAGAEVVVAPSDCYETFGRAAVEAFAVGTPVVAPDHGALAEVVTPGATGVHFRARQAGSLAGAVADLWADAAARRLMGRRARAEYESKYTADIGYGALMETYKDALNGSETLRHSAEAAG